MNAVALRDIQSFVMRFNFQFRADIRQGIEIVRGIGKHGPGENLFLVFKDPDGNYVEYYAEMVQVTADTPHAPKVWKNGCAGHPPAGVCRRPVAPIML